MANPNISRIIGSAGFIFFLIRLGSLPMELRTLNGHARACPDFAVDILNVIS